jgi:Na+/H+ antiporter NhaD/arsenite permease-like protein
MIVGTLQNRPYTASSASRFEGFDLRVILFLALIGFMLFWAFWGRSLEKRVYGEPPRGLRSLDYLGVEIAVSQSSGRAPTVIVMQVYPNSPAERAGLKPHDRIVGLDGRLVSSVEMAMHIMGSKKSGTLLKLTINRNGRNEDIYVEFTEPLLESQVLKNNVLKKHSFSIPKRLLVLAVFLKLAALLFYLLYKHVVDRTTIVLLFAAAILFMGIYLESYSPLDAFFAIKFNTLSLLLGMGVISVVLNESGFFEQTAHRVGKFAGGNIPGLLILLCLITYFFSLLVNNLTTILVIVPITLSLAAALEFDPRPMIIGEVISSNLGGASTMVGDFPNMLISSETGIGFSEFIIYMMPICLILLGILLMYLRLKIGDFSVADHQEFPRKQIRAPRLSLKQRKARRKAIFVLCHVVFLFVISEKTSLNPSAVALFGGLSLFLFSGIDRRKILSGLGFNDILFFTGLFVVVGGLEASGLLQYIAKGLTLLSFGKPWLLCLVLMWSAAALTAFLNAGPATTLFFPIVLGLTLSLPHHVMWWALSLGVLAGSSATIFGATAGPVAAGLMESFGSRAPLELPGGNTITFRQFARTGVPVMLLFLSVSSVYVTYLYFGS